MSLEETLGLIGFFRKAERVFKNIIGFRSVSLTEANRITYNSLNRVDAYAHMIDLQKPEQTILGLLRTKPPLRRILDIGVGGGRTTKYFAKLTKEYVGIDYSENMIKVCREKFRKYPKISFVTADARNLSIFEDNYFDFVLFSHGGLDGMEHEDRLRILHEIWRVAKSGGYFGFSTSNLDAMLQFCQIELSKHPKVLAKNLIRLLLIRQLNPQMWKYVRGKRKDLNHTMFIIGADDWGLKTYCITPEAQVIQLKDSGFENIRTYDLQGKEITGLPNTTDVELYYLCTIRKHD
jgi:ubiquinone/menaquinone biosynthesis C-methylase UbiE